MVCFKKSIILILVFLIASCSSKKVVVNNNCLTFYKHTPEYQKDVSIKLSLECKSLKEVLEVELLQDTTREKIEYLYLNCNLYDELFLGYDYLRRQAKSCKNN